MSSGEYQDEYQTLVVFVLCRCFWFMQKMTQNPKYSVKLKYRELNQFSFQSHAAFVFNPVTLAG